MARSNCKRLKRAREELARATPGSLGEAIAFVREHASAKFDETIEVATRLGVDPKYADQMVRGAVVLPHGPPGITLAGGDDRRQHLDVQVH